MRARGLNGRGFFTAGPAAGGTRSRRSDGSSTGTFSGSSAMTEAEFDQLLALGEKQRIEYKGAGSATDTAFIARIARAVLAMANRHDGGLVIIGVEEQARRLTCVGLDDPTRATWQARDNVEAAINAYADPSASFDIEFEPLSRRCVIIRVREFSDVPLLCKKGFTDPGKGGKEILRQGGCYVRPRRNVSSSEIAFQEDMRELIELATRKGIDKFVAQMRSGGFLRDTQPEPSDADRYEQELGDE